MTDTPLLSSRRRVAALARSLRSAREQIAGLPAERRRAMDDWAAGLAERVREDQQAAVFDNETVNKLHILDGKEEGLPELVETIKDRLATAVVEYAQAQVADLRRRLAEGESVEQRLLTWAESLRLLGTDPSAVLPDVVDHALRAEEEGAGR